VRVDGCRRDTGGPGSGGSGAAGQLTGPFSPTCRQLEGRRPPAGKSPKIMFRTVPKLFRSFDKIRNTTPPQVRGALDKVVFRVPVFWIFRF